MNRFVCNDGYKEDLREFSSVIIQKYGTTSQTAEREILYLAEAGNVVAKGSYADLLFYKKIMRKDPYKEAFALYLEAAGISIDEEGVWQCSGIGYPVSFWDVGYYLMNYHRSSFLKACETIDVIEAMTLGERLKVGLELAISSIIYSSAPSAFNLVGRILYEASGNEVLFATLRDVCKDEVIAVDLSEYGISGISCEDQTECAKAAEAFFHASAKAGYVYACNNLATQEGDRIIELMKNNAAKEEIHECVQNYIDYLQRAADKYEPYAANRLGMFYVEGEVKGTKESVYLKDHIIPALAKEYFYKATVYPDANSAWAFLNLLTHFHSDYTRDLALLNEHMGYIEKLNPAVYDIAMEL